jgi:hypothetical protein
MQKYTDVVTSARSGAAIPSASVTVKTSPGGVTATIYSDDGITTQSNPLTTDSNGEFTFYAADGEYTLTVSGTGITERTVGPIILHDPADSDDYMPSTDVSFTPSGSGMVAEDMQGVIRRLPWINLLSACSDAKRATILAGTQTDITTELTAAIATGRPIWAPYGQYEISSPVACGVNLFFQGADTNQSTIILTGTGQLTTNDTDAQWLGGCRVKTAVNSLTMIKAGHSRWKCDWSLEATGGATGVTGVEWVVGTGLYHCVWTPAETRSVAVANRVTGANPFNNNQIGADHTNWFTGTDFLRIENTGVNQRNRVKGYVETYTNILTTASGAGTVSINTFDVWPDGHTNVVNATANVGENHWTDVTPGDWVESLNSGATVARQIFDKKITCRVYLTTADQTINDNTETKIEFNAESFDVGSCFTASPNYRWEAKRSGRIRVYAQASISGNLAEADRINLSIYKDGALHSQMRMHVAGTSAFGRPSISDFVDVVKGNYIEIYAFANETAAGNSHTVANGTTVTYATFEEV